MMEPRKSKRMGLAAKAVLSGALIVGAGSLGGCDNAGQGMFSGAVLGTLTGLALGSLDGNAGEGALTGLIVGTAGGAIIGDQNEREREDSRYRGSDHRYDTRYDRRHRSHSHRHGHYNDPWWEEDWCD
jgi:Glycine zipper